MTENVVCIPGTTIPDGFYLITGSDNAYLDEMAGLRFFALRDKSDKSDMALENNKTIRQLVTYLFVQQGNRFLIYNRTKQTGETRLADMYACPGGHMNSLSKNFFRDITRDAMREFNEELVVTAENAMDAIPKTTHPIAIIQSSCDELGNGVNLVHTGIVVKIQLSTKCKVDIREDAQMQDLQWIDIGSASSFFSKSEGWLKFLLPWTHQLLEL